MKLARDTDEHLRRRPLRGKPLSLLLLKALCRLGQPHRLEEPQGTAEVLESGVGTDEGFPFQVEGVVSTKMSRSAPLTVAFNIATKLSGRQVGGTILTP